MRSIIAANWAIIPLTVIDLYHFITLGDFSGATTPPWRHLPAKPIGFLLLGSSRASTETLEKKNWDAALLSFFATARSAQNTFWSVTSVTATERENPCVILSIDPSDSII